MKATLFKWLKGTGIVFLWILSGVSILAIFTGMLWVTGGSMKGYPALIISIISAFLISRVAVVRSSSTTGKILRLIPVTIFLMIVFWAMIPMQNEDFVVPDNEPEFEMWELGNGRSVSMSHHQPNEDIHPKNAAILFIHGGPGAYVRDFDREFVAGFTEEGYHVFVYDQVGAGRSPILDDATRYTHQGNVADLEKVIARINMPLTLIGQSYGAALVSSFMEQFGTDYPVQHIILTEPGPLPGAYPNEGLHYDEKTTSAEHFEGPHPLEMISGPRFLLGMILPVDNQFVRQQEMINSINPYLQDKIVSTSFCTENTEPIPNFRNLPVNILASRNIRSTFMKVETPDLTHLEIPVMLLLGECSYFPRGYVMEYFDVFNIQRSHLIPGVGHILWGTENGKQLTRKAMLSFLDGTEMPLPNEPNYDSRFEFIEQGR